MSATVLPMDIKLGLGCMGMSQWYGEIDEQESAATIHEALDNGLKYLDTAEAYGPHHNEELVGKAISGRRHETYLATKFGFPSIQSDGSQIAPNSNPSHIRKSVEGSLRRLQTDYIDLLYQHRVDRSIPIEDVVGAMADLVREGKVRHIGLCEVGTETINRAYAVHPLTAVQAEYSLWERNLELDIIPLAEKLNIAIVAFCPLGRGYLTANSPKPTSLTENDFRRLDPRFTESNFRKNMKFLDVIRHHAARKQTSPAQLAIAWILARSSRIIPIPGTRRRKHLRENIAATEILLNPSELQDLDRDIADLVTAGHRYNEAMLQYIDR